MVQQTTTRIDGEPARIAADLIEAFSAPARRAGVASAEAERQAAATLGEAWPALLEMLRQQAPELADQLRPCIAGVQQTLRQQAKAAAKAPNTADAVPMASAAPNEAGVAPNGDSPETKGFAPAKPLGLADDPLPPERRPSPDRARAASGLARLLDRECGGHQVQQRRAALDDPEGHRWLVATRGWEATSDALSRRLKGRPEIQRACEEAATAEEELGKIADGHQLLQLLAALVELVPELLRLAKDGYDDACA